MFPEPPAMHSSRTSLRRGAVCASLSVLALALPAEATAARSADEEPTASPIGLITGFGVGLTVEAQRAIHPVAGPVDYGSAEASFGNERGRPHEGQDVFAPAGTRLVSPTQATVVEAGSDGGRGNWVALHDPAGDRTFVYFHMLEPSVVEAGQRLRPGDLVGRVGCTGSCYGDHLHFEIRDGRDPYGTARDPLPELIRWGR